MRQPLAPFTDWLSDYIARYGEPSEHTLRLAAEDEAAQLRARVTELSAALDAANSGKNFYYVMYLQARDEALYWQKEATR